ncbi:hypothetical protein GCM10010170_035020 [Dactylosporangium salmoneum]|uniref:D-ribose pyranase n=1 Tax=Dactylosporangium salmoneum TaxID=53361 RepID=A0ABN3GAC0_9ACTN
MKVHELHARLGELIEQGHGDLLVIDNSGNDVCGAEPPWEPGDEGVMLDCHVDQELRRG